MPERHIFRQAALQRLANPERLDLPLALETRHPRLALLALGLVALAALVWFLLGLFATGQPANPIPPAP